VEWFGNRRSTRQKREFVPRTLECSREDSGVGSPRASEKKNRLKVGLREARCQCGMESLGQLEGLGQV